MLGVVTGNSHMLRHFQYLASRTQGTQELTLPGNGTGIGETVADPDVALTTALARVPAATSAAYNVVQTTGSARVFAPVASSAAPNIVRPQEEG